LYHCTDELVIFEFARKKSWCGSMRPMPEDAAEHMAQLPVAFAILSDASFPLEFNEFSPLFVDLLSPVLDCVCSGERSIVPHAHDVAGEVEEYTCVDVLSAAFAVPSTVWQLFVSDDRQVQREPTILRISMAASHLMK
jgi:hypothetical protein